MTIQLAKQTNPDDHVFYIAYICPIKFQIDKAIQDGKLGKLELVDFSLPDNASVLVDENGVECIYVDNKPVNIFTDVASGKVYLMNSESCTLINKVGIPATVSSGKIIAFPSDNFVA